MDRRHFLKLLGIGAAGIAAPKFIFDMGKNSRIYMPTYKPYEVYKIDGHLGVYQPDGTFFFGPGVTLMSMEMTTEGVRGRVIASTRADIPQGKIIHPGYRNEESFLRRQP